MPLARAGVLLYDVGGANGFDVVIAICATGGAGLEFGASPGRLAIVRTTLVVG
jgi:hypothetical protein